MAWNEIFLNRRLSPDAILNAVGQLFNVNPHDIVVSHDDRWYDFAKDPNMVMICDLTPIAGDFPLRLRIIANREHVPHAAPFDGSSVGMLCELLDCNALAELDEDYDPYTFMLVRSRNEVLRVRVNADRLDNDGAFELE